ncbi:MAG: GNAT family N-acetyltransferase [Rhizobiaceae bacterium]|nr:GNAT family N-acetyltransferase [Rhizobiaceae bacterium]
MNQVGLRRLRRSDITLLSAWLNAPHLRPFYMQEPIAPDEVVAKFLPRIGGRHRVRCIVAECGGRPFGYLQWYYNRSYPADSAAAAGEPDGVSIDYYIGDPGFLGQGLGSEMLLACRSDLDTRLAGRHRLIFIQHDDRNEAARRCTESAGFQQVRGFRSGARDCTLYRADPLPTAT